MQIKISMRIIIHQSEKLKAKWVTLPSAGKDGMKLDLSFISGENVKW